MDTDLLLVLAMLPLLAAIIWLQRRQQARIREDPTHPLHDARPWPLRVQLALAAIYIGFLAFSLLRHHL